MSLEQPPKFTPQAAKLWAEIPAHERKLFLANTWCSHCNSVVRIKNFNCRVDTGDLVLVGQCGNCDSAVARVVEVDWAKLTLTALEQLITVSDSSDMHMRICIWRPLYVQKKTETASNSSQAERWSLSRNIQSLMSPVGADTDFFENAWTKKFDCEACVYLSLRRMNRYALNRTNQHSIRCD